MKEVDSGVGQGSIYLQVRDHLCYVGGEASWGRGGVQTHWHDQREGECQHEGWHVLDGDQQVWLGKVVEPSRGIISISKVKVTTRKESLLGH